ncbi:hypothetical protein GUJ93_ZPchr0012g20432 [Zizania palustris]|uniref:Uncharacterized protein n=1 Tax=Zizania palustris TaxID=103762 RepID=A0A8J5WT02_ZIZPA|nr:hypothetical protein GUJ93_ZPchr0012g20432 [Zizania palustris]
MEGWTASEIEEAISLVSSINNSGNEKNHSSIVEELQDLFPWKTIHEVLNLYIKLVREMRLLAQNSINTSVLHSNVVHENTRLVKNGSFKGLKEEEADAMFNSEGLMLIDYPLEEMKEIGDHQTKEAQALMVVQTDLHRAPSKRVLWTSEEHRLFLQGMSIFGRGDWKNISKHFVTTRTPAQISSHAQKHFLRMEREGGGGTATTAEATVVPVIKKQRCYRLWGGGASEDGRHQAAASGNWPTTNIDVAAPALAFSGFNYNTTSLALPPNPSMQSLAKVGSPVMYRHPTVIQAAVPLTAAASSSMAAPGQQLGASLSQPWTMNRMH